MGGGPVPDPRRRRGPERRTPLAPGASGVLCL